MSEQNIPNKATEPQSNLKNSNENKSVSIDIPKRLIHEIVKQLGLVVGEIKLTSTAGEIVKIGSIRNHGHFFYIVIDSIGKCTFENADGQYFPENDYDIEKATQIYKYIKMMESKGCKISAPIDELRRQEALRLKEIREMNLNRKGVTLRKQELD